MTEHPDADADLLALYGFDMDRVYQGTASVDRARSLVERLTIDPQSVFRAKLLGGDGPDDDWQEWVGYDATAQYVAALIDAVQVNTAVTAAHGSRRQPRSPDPIHRPGMSAAVARPADEPQQASTLADLNLRGIAAMMNQ